MNPALQKALGLEFFDRFIQNPLVDATKLTQDAIRLFDKNPDDLLKSPEQLQQGLPVQPGQEQGRPNTQRSGNIASQLSAAAQPELQALIQGA